MSLLLNIDTSTETAHVSLTHNENIIALIENTIQKEHAAFIHPAIRSMMEQAGKSMQELDAIAVTAGPGSYTGIRVGLASAKGLCFALKKPLITLNTLEILARDVINQYKEDPSLLYCPMIDARRMEVYTALYNYKGTEIIAPAALVINEDSFRIYSTKGSLVLFGSGAQKCKDQPAFENVLFTENVNIPEAMAHVSHEKYLRKLFSDVIFSDPYYLKEFYNKPN
jgi:tRNA threonylcarbamoyladenosine biosynthesis protein TsaB